MSGRRKTSEGRVVKHSKRYVVQWDNLGEWEDDASFTSLRRAKRYARTQTAWMPYHYRVIDMEASNE